MSDDREFITRERCDALMPPGDRVHTFIGGAGMVIGCDVDRVKILSAADEGLVELAGPSATAMKHGLCWYDNGRATFVETKTISP